MSDATRPSFDAVKLRKTLREFDRSPFTDLLAEWVECAPDRATILQFAKRSPHMYVHALVALAKLSGFAEKAEVQHHHHHDLTKMSDVELEQRVLDMNRKIGLAAPAVLDGKEMAPATEVTEAILVIDGEFSESEG